MRVMRTIEEDMGPHVQVGLSRKIGGQGGYISAKSWLIVKKDMMETATDAFKDTGINITCEGKRHLGAALGTRTFVEEYVQRKVADLSTEGWPVSLVMKHLGSDHLPKRDLIVYMQRGGTPEWLRRWKLHGTTGNIKKNRLLAEACSQGDWLAVQQLLSQGRNIHQPGEDGESLLSLACSAGSYELAEVLLKMRSGMDDEGLKTALL